MTIREILQGVALVAFIAACTVFVANDWAYARMQGRIDVATGQWECRRIDYGRDVEWECTERQVAP